MSKSDGRNRHPVGRRPARLAAVHPLVAGVWTLALVGLAATKALPLGVAIYGLTLLAMAVAMYAPAGEAARPPAPARSAAR